MRGNADPEEADDPRPTAVEDRLRALPAGAPPLDLLSRCLETIPVPGSGNRPSRRRIAFRLAIAATLLLSVSAWLGRPIETDAAAQLKAVRAAWTTVATSHRVATWSTTEGVRTEETWFVRGKGRRIEVRSGRDRISLAVDNGRWQFRFDERAGLVAAWSTALSVAPDRLGDAGILFDGEAFLRWAEDHRGEIRVVREALGAIAARKVVVRWPGPAAGSPFPREQAVWFDPDSHRPLRQRVEYGDGKVSEMTIDYPAPDAVPADLFAFQPPRDAAIEINDPDLGRQVYSPAPTRGEDR